MFRSKPARKIFTRRGCPTRAEPTVMPLQVAQPAHHLIAKQTQLLQLHRIKSSALSFAEKNRTHFPIKAQWIRAEIADLLFRPKFLVVACDGSRPFILGPDDFLVLVQA